MTTSQQFFDAWSAARAALGSGSVEGIARLIERLRNSATNAQERSLIAPVEIEAGAITNDTQLRNVGIDRLEGADPASVVRAVATLSDVAMIGTIDRRLSVLRQPLRMHVDAGDTGFRFVSNPTVDAARVVASGGWQPPLELGAKIARELRRWVAWTALDSWLDWRHPGYLDCLNDGSVAFPADEPGAWEYQLLIAAERLSIGDVDTAVSRLRAVLRRMDPASSWARAAVVATLTRYLPLAGARVTEVLAEFPTGESDRQFGATSIERAGSAFASLCSANCTGRSAKFARIEADLVSSPWLLFCYFVSVPPGEVRTRLAVLLVESVRHEDDVKRWPWISREQAFADACRTLGAADTALTLLDLALRAAPHPALADACVEILETAKPDDLIPIVGSQLGDRLGDHTKKLSIGRQMMLARGGVWRAIVDGSNVCFGGKSKGAGARPKIEYLLQAQNALEQAGFTEIHTYVDKGMHRHLGDSAWSRIESLQVKNSVQVTNENSDAHIIRDFLRVPSATWIVTNDMFREFGAEFPRLKAHFPRNQLRFYIDANDRVCWERRLDRNGGSK
jgi:hypothetical protein